MLRYAKHMRGRCSFFSLDPFSFRHRTLRPRLVNPQVGTGEGKSMIVAVGGLGAAKGPR